MEELQDRFRQMLSRHLEMADKLVESSRLMVEEQAERVRQTTLRGADTAPSQALLEKLQDALNRRVQYRERLRQEFGAGDVGD